MSEADKRVSQHLAAVRRKQLANRDELGRIEPVHPSPLAEWMDKRGYGQLPRAKDSMVTSIYIPKRARAALGILSQQRGMTMNYLICEAIAEIIKPLLTEPSRSLIDEQPLIDPPSRMKSAKPALPKQRGFLTDRR